MPFSRRRFHLIAAACLAAALPVMAAAPPAPTAGTVAVNAGWPLSGAQFAFAPEPFAKVPVVVVTAERSGKALLAAADLVTTRDFIVRLVDPSTGELVGDGGGVEMRSVAIVPDAKSGIVAGSAPRADGDNVAFTAPFPSVPVVVCSAYDPVGKTPLRACALDVTRSSFTISLRNRDGSPGSGIVDFIAIAANPGGTKYKEVTIAAATLTVSQGGEVSFGPGLPRSPLGLLCSASADGVACAAGFDRQNDGGFTAVVAGDDGADPGKVTFSWVGVCTP
jgi:hypothetical protein